MMRRRDPSTVRISIRKPEPAATVAVQVDQPRKHKIIVRRRKLLGITMIRDSADPGDPIVIEFDDPVRNLTLGRPYESPAQNPHYNQPFRPHTTTVFTTAR
jgi:hypothetical protein